MRTGFKDKKSVPLDSLLLDEHNPRLGYAVDQEACISKMISFGAPFFAIARDIAEKGLTIEPIVILKQGSKYVVKDGNRRISALKLLNRPFLSPEKSVQERFERLARIAEQNGNLIHQVDCQIGTSLDNVNEYISRVHTGENGGVGRKQWGSLQQEYFQLSIGEKGNYWRAAKLLLWADKNDIDIPEDIAVTTMGRYFNAIKNIKLLGFNFDEDDNLIVETPLILAISVAKRLVEDLLSGKAHVSRNEVNGTFSMMSAPGREHYIEVVRREVGLTNFEASQGREMGHGSPTSDRTPEGDKTANPNGAGDSPVSTTDQSKPGTPPTTAPSQSSNSGSTPIAHSANRAKYVTRGGHPLKLPKHEQKLRDIYKELTILEKCPIAAMMLVRAFVEGTFKAYVLKFQLNRGSIDSITIKDMLRLIKNKLLKDEKITEGSDYYQKIEDLLAAQLVSIPSMQKYIHSEIFNPRDEKVKNTWDDFYYLLKLIWEEIDLVET